MRSMVEKIYKGLEQEGDLWNTLENSEYYSSVNNELQKLNKEIQEILEEKKGRDGRSMIFDQEELYYRLLTCAEKYFFEEGFIMGARLAAEMHQKK